MNKIELNQHLNFVLQPNGELQIILYGCFAEGIVKKLDVKGDDLPAIVQLFVDSIKERILNKDDYSVIPLSKADERNKDLLPEDLWNEYDCFRHHYCYNLENIFYIDKSPDLPTPEELIKQIKVIDGVSSKKIFCNNIYIEYDRDGYLERLLK